MWIRRSRAKRRLRRNVCNCFGHPLAPSCESTDSEPMPRYLEAAKLYRAHLPKFNGGINYSWSAEIIE